MNLGEMKNAIMFQTNNDVDDLGDFMPYLTDYINEGYDRLLVAFRGEHVSADSESYTPLSHDKSTPELPDWVHRAIVDYATWLVYRNGNTQKQSRGQQYLYAFNEVLMKLNSMSDAEKGLLDEKGNSLRTKHRTYFINIPV